MCCKTMAKKAGFWGVGEKAGDAVLGRQWQKKAGFGGWGEGRGRGREAGGGAGHISLQACVVHDTPITVASADLAGFPSPSNMCACVVFREGV